MKESELKSNEFVATTPNHSNLLRQRPLAFNLFSFLPISIIMILRLIFLIYLFLKKNLSNLDFRFCSIFNADLALSVTLTAISTLLSTIALPANLLLYANLAYHADVTSELDWVSVFIALAVVISAIAMGLYCSYRSHSYKFNILCNKIGNAAGLFLIVFSATVTNTGDADSRIWSRHWSFYVAIMLPCIMGLIIASGLAMLLKLLKPEQMTVAVECCYQVSPTHICNYRCCFHCYCCFGMTLF